MLAFITHFHLGDTILELVLVNESHPVLTCRVVDTLVVLKYTGHAPGHLGCITHPLAHNVFQLARCHRILHPHGLLLVLAFYGIILFLGLLQGICHHITTHTMHTVHGSIGGCSGLFPGHDVCLLDSCLSKHITHLYTDILQHFVQLAHHLCVLTHGCGVCLSYGIDGCSCAHIGLQGFSQALHPGGQYRARDELAERHGTKGLCNAHAVAVHHFLYLGLTVGFKDGCTGFLGDVSQLLPGLFLGFLAFQGGAFSLFSGGFTYACLVLQYYLGSLLHHHIKYRFRHVLQGAVVRHCTFHAHQG